MSRFERIGQSLLVATLLSVMGWLAGCARKPAPQAESPLRPLKFPLERTQARLARGKYLAWAVTGCFDCHSIQIGALRKLHPSRGR